MGSLGPTEIILIAMAFLLIFGAKRIPEMARGLGKGIREFKKATNEISRELTVDDKRSHQIQPPPQTYTYAPPPAQQQQAPPAAPPPAEPSAAESQP